MKHPPHGRHGSPPGDDAPRSEKGGAGHRELEFSGRRIVIHETGNPHEARLSIDGQDIPLHYHEGFEGWGVWHTLYGFLPDLELVAEQMIVCNPALIIGHGDAHDGGSHHH